MTITGPDVSTYQSGINYALAAQQGHAVTYIKLGGDNIPRYVSGSYAGLVDKARAAGLRVGHYWVTGGHDPEVAAAFFLANLHNAQPGDFFVLDNEPLDDGNAYDDDEAARWVRTVQGGVSGAPNRLFHYSSQSQTNSHGWPETLATGCSFIIANYNDSPFRLTVTTIPAERIMGHQYTSSGSAGGLSPIDMNAFKDNAFDYQGDEMSQADVDAINAHTTAEINRLAEYVRRESRLRLYKNTATGQFMAASIETGRYEILSGQSEVDSLVSNGYLEIAAGDAASPQAVDQTRWDNIIAKCPVDIKALTK